jgi:phosphatidylserine/phosphatidylglycerophosphate/cardiolipin synthase-like enzyme
MARDLFRPPSVRRIMLALFFLAVVAGSSYFIRTFDKVELPSAQYPVEIYANLPNHNIEKAMIDSIERAEKSIVLVIFALTDPKVIAALKDKAEEGVDVLVVYDYQASPDIPKRLGDKVNYIKRRANGLMHQKILVVDNLVTWIGSANLTGESLRVHDNLMNAIRSEGFADMVTAKAKSYASETFQPFTYRNFQIGDQVVELWFLPDNKDAIDRLTYLIEKATKSIRIAMFTWTRRDLAKAVIAAHQRGVKVEVVLDRNSAEGAGAEIKDMLCAEKIPVYLSKGDALMHNKFMEVDDRNLINGSANWTLAAFNDNDDNFIILTHLTHDQNLYMDDVWKELLLHSEAACK